MGMSLERSFIELPRAPLKDDVLPLHVALPISPVGAEQFEIVFRAARNYPSVVEVTFEGNKGVPQYVLRDAIGGVAVGQPRSEEHTSELQSPVHLVCTPQRDEEKRGVAEVPVRQ